MYSYKFENKPGYLRNIEKSKENHAFTSDS